MERFKLIADGLDTGPLLKRILANEHLWAERTERQNYPGSAHKDTETIYLRWAVDESVEGGFYDLRSKDHVETITALAPDVFPLCQTAIEKIVGHAYSYNDDVGRVILTRMKPWGVITEHVDEGPYADKYDRFHVCLQGESILNCGGAHQKMAPGQLWWFNHKLPHYVTNHVYGRIHLIIDLVAPEYRAKRGLTFQRERVTDLWDEVTPLLVKHKDEVCHYKDFVLNPDVESYAAIERAGGMRCYTARLNGDLIGYCALFVKHNLHYRDSLQALQDVLFILPEHRGSRAGFKLIRFCEEQLRSEGIQVIMQHLKLATPKTVELFRKMGYEDIDVIMGKRLDR